MGCTAGPLSTAAELALGAVAGALAQIFTIPVSVIATRQQVGRSVDRPKSKGKGKETAKEGDVEAEKEKEDAYDDSFFGVAREIIAEEGVAGLWLGLRPGLVLTVNPAITYGMFERVKSLLLTARGETNMNAKLTPWMAFAVGAVSKALATVVRALPNYPCLIAVNVDWFASRVHNKGHISVHHGEGAHPGAYRRS